MLCTIFSSSAYTDASSVSNFLFLFIFFFFFFLFIIIIFFYFILFYFFFYFFIFYFFFFFQNLGADCTEPVDTTRTTTVIYGYDANCYRYNG